MKHLTIIPPLRGYDSQGSGSFGAPRGTRTHIGIDIACYKDSKVLAVCGGKVTKLGYPYNQGEPKPEWSQKKKDKFYKKKALRYVQVTDVNDYDVRYFYISPSVSVGDTVSEGDIVGAVQGLTDIYEGITDHYHFEVKKNGRVINPNEYLEDL